jgi:hypothetical protein
MYFMGRLENEKSPPMIALREKKWKRGSKQ